MTEPTALAQLRHLYQNMVNGAVRDTASAKRIAEGLLAPAIEALERGTPPVVAGEPVAYRYKFKDDLQWQYTCNKSQAHRLAVVEPLYTTPQPTQAQAGAVPLTPKQVAEIADAAHSEYDRLVGSGQCAPRWSAVFAHLLERAHGIGIKGVQHGTDN